MRKYGFNLELSKNPIIVTVWETMAPPKNLSVCPVFMAYISATKSQILMKLDGNVKTQVRLIVLKFHKNWFSFDVHYDVINDDFMPFCKGTEFCGIGKNNFKAKALLGIGC